MPTRNRTEWLREQLSGRGTPINWRATMGLPDEPRNFDAEAWRQMTPEERRQSLSGRVPPRQALVNQANRLLVSHRARKAADNAAHEEHARQTAARHQTGETTAAQGDNTPLDGSGGTPTPVPAPPLQSASKTNEAVDAGYRSRIQAIRMPDGRIVFTNVPDEYVAPDGPMPEGAPQRMLYEDAIGELGGSVSTPMQTESGGMAYIHPEDLPTAPLESRRPMSPAEIVERGATLAAAEGKTDTRSMMERRAWTERRQAEERAKALEEAQIAKEQLAADPEFAQRMAELESQARWGGDYLEQTATAEQRQLAAQEVEIYGPAILRAVQAGDHELAKALDAQLRMRLRALGISVPEPRSGGLGDLLLPQIQETVDEKVKEKKSE